MTDRKLAFVTMGLLLSGQAALVGAQTPTAGTASNRTALGVLDPDQSGYCPPKADGSPGDCAQARPERRGAFRPGSVPVLLGAVGAAGLGVAAAAGGGGRRNGAPVSP